MSGRDEVILAVEDEGHGIPPEELDNIFQPFRSSFERGTGLGLAIVHRIVSDYGGVIQVSSTVGVGTTVCVRFPVRSAPAVASAERALHGRSRVKTQPLRASSADTDLAAPAGRRPPSRAFSSSTTNDRCARCCRSFCGATATTSCVAENGRDAIERLHDEPFDLLLSDIRMPDVSGVEVLRAAKEINPDLVAFMMTAFASTDTAVEAMRLGAVDYFVKPFSMDELRLKVRQHLEARRLKQENLLLKRALNSRHEFSNILGRSDAMQQVFATIEQVAATNSTVLISGESGTGKELVARAIHFNSLRRDRPFVAVNCGAVPETLLESELFGHVRGAFTGAHANKKGLVEAAEGGTIFLDEIGEMATSMQVKLLRVLQDRRFRRLGGTEEVQADVRVIAATQPGPAEDGRRRTVSRRPVLSTERSRDQAAAAARPPWKTFRCWPSSSCSSSPSQMGKRVQHDFGARPCTSAAAPMARQRAGAPERHGAGRRARTDRGRPPGEPARGRAAGSRVGRWPERRDSCPLWARGSTWRRAARRSIATTLPWRSNVPEASRSRRRSSSV